MIPLPALGALLMAAQMHLLWRLQRRTGNAAVVDAGWAFGLGLLALFYAPFAAGLPARRALVAAMASLWAFRLALHLWRDRIRGRPEEGRYRTLRARWGARAERNLWIFFQAQGLLDALLSVAFLRAMSGTGPLGAFDAAGAFLWLAAVAGEGVADAQLARFRARPENRGRTCREGLWRLSRHPNYFFEWLHWLSYVLVSALDPWTLLPAAAMLFLILFVTGIPPTEAQAIESRGDDYRDYQRTTSTFFPWFPRRGRAPERAKREGPGEGGAPRGGSGGTGR